MPARAELMYPLCTRARGGWPTLVQALDSRGREEVALQACWPRFLASHRIMYAKPVKVTLPGEQPYLLAAAAETG